MKILILILAVMFAACVDSESTVEQKICTIEDQEAGTCPPGGLSILQWTQQTQQTQAQSQLPGQTPTQQGSSCSSGGSVCASDWHFNTVWGAARLITSCNSCECRSTLCYADEEPCMHIQPSPQCMR